MVHKLAAGHYNGEPMSLILSSFTWFAVIAVVFALLTVTREWTADGQPDLKVLKAHGRAAN
jgi:hypothetical protein